MCSVDVRFIEASATLTHATDFFVRGLTYRGRCGMLDSHLYVTFGLWNLQVDLATGTMCCCLVHREHVSDSGSLQSAFPGGL